MNQIVKTRRVISSVCLTLFVLVFAALVDTASSTFMGINFMSLSGLDFSSLVQEVLSSGASAQGSPRPVDIDYSMSSSRTFSVLLNGMAESICVSNFLLAFLMTVSNS